MLGLFLFVLVLALGESLHAAWHADAGDPGHHCAITGLHHGQVVVPICQASISAVPISEAMQEMVQAWHISRSYRFLPPACGPPRP